MNWKREYPKYEEWMKEGSAYAMGIVAQCYIFGKGVEKDVAKGVKLLKRAANKGDVEAIWTLANFYMGSHGEDIVGIDHEKAKKLYLKLIRLKRGYTDNARSCLAEIYWDTNRKLAEKYLYESKARIVTDEETGEVLWSRREYKKRLKNKGV